MEFYEIAGKRKRGIFERFSLTAWLIAVNTVLFIVFYILVSLNVISLTELSLIPLKIISGNNLWTLITSMFMHAGIAHLIFNMISLFFVGSLVERLIGKRRYFWFYMVAGVFAGLVFAALSGFFGYGIGAKIFGDPSVGGVGASGAIFGLVGILSVLIPRKKVSLIAGPLLAIVIDSFLVSAFPSPAVNAISIFFSFYIFLSIFAIFSFNSKLYKISLPVEMPFWLIPFLAIIPLVIIGLFVNLPIGNSAHFGGLVAGLLYGFYLRKKYPNKLNYLSRHFN